MLARSNFLLLLLRAQDLLESFLNEIKDPYKQQDLLNPNYIDFRIRDALCVSFDVIAHDRTSPVKSQGKQQEVLDGFEEFRTDLIFKEPINDAEIEQSTQREQQNERNGLLLVRVVLQIHHYKQHFENHVKNGEDFSQHGFRCEVDFRSDIHKFKEYENPDHDDLCQKSLGFYHFSVPSHSVEH